MLLEERMKFKGFANLAHLIVHHKMMLLKISQVSQENTCVLGPLSYLSKNLELPKCWQVKSQTVDISLSLLWEPTCLPYLLNLSLREKCPNTELFLVHIFLYSDWITLYLDAVCFFWYLPIFSRVYYEWILTIG